MVYREIRIFPDCVCVASMFYGIISLNVDINSKQRHFIPRRKHSSVIKTFQVTLYREIRAFCSKSHKRVEFMYVEHDGT